MILLVATAAAVICWAWARGPRAGAIFGAASVLWYPARATLSGSGLLLGDNIYATELMVAGVGAIALVRAGRAHGRERGPLGTASWLVVALVVSGGCALVLGWLGSPAPSEYWGPACGFWRRFCLGTALFWGASGLLERDESLDAAAGSLCGISTMMVGIIMDPRGAETWTLDSDAGQLAGVVPLPFGTMLEVGGNSTALLGATAVLVGLGLSLSRSGLLLRLTGLVAVGVCVAGVALLATRAVLVFLPLPILCLLWCARRDITVRGLAIAIATGLAGTTIIAGVVSANWGDYQSRRWLQLVGVLEGSNAETVEVRVRQYEFLGALVMREPLGVGYRAIYDEFEIQPHSLYLKVALATGLPGAVAYVWFLGSLGLNLARGPADSWLRMRQAVSLAIACILVLGLGYDLLSRMHLHLPFLGLCLPIARHWRGTASRRGELRVSSRKHRLNRRAP